MKDHDWRYKIGKAATNMLRLTDLGVPNPDQVVYEPYQKDEMRGDLTWAGRGYQSFKMVWDILSVDQMNTLNRFLFASQNSVTGYGWLYTSVDDGWSKNAGNSFHLYEVNVKRPLLNSQDGQRVVRSARAYSSVAYYFTIISQEEADFTSNFVTGSYYPVSVTFTDTSTAGQLS